MYQELLLIIKSRCCVSGGVYLEPLNFDNGPAHSVDLYNWVDVLYSWRRGSPSLRIFDLVGSDTVPS